MWHHCNKIAAACKPLCEVKLLNVNLRHHVRQNSHDTPNNLVIGWLVRPIIEFCQILLLPKMTSLWWIVWKHDFLFLLYVRISDCYPFPIEIWKYPSLSPLSCDRLLKIYLTQGIYIIANRAGASTRFTSTSTSTSTCNMCEYEYESEYLIITWVRVRVLVDE